MDLTVVSPTGTLPREFRQTQNQIRNMAHYDQRPSSPHHLILLADPDIAYLRPSTNPH